MDDIECSVGIAGINGERDTRLVQVLLNRHVKSIGITPLKVDGRLGSATIRAVCLFQVQVAKIPKADGRVDPGDGPGKP